MSAQWKKNDRYQCILKVNKLWLAQGPFLDASHLGRWLGMS